MFREDASNVPDYRFFQGYGESRFDKAKFNGLYSLLEVVRGIILKAQRGFAHGQEGHQNCRTHAPGPAAFPIEFNAIVRVHSVPQEIH